MLVALDKPFRTLCRFTDGYGRRTLADCLPLPGVSAAVRLDLDGQGLLLLTDDGRLPRHSRPARSSPC